MKPGGAIVNTTSINSKSPNPTLLPYATTKGAIANFTAGLAQLLAKQGIRVNCVAPGPIWTPLIPSTMRRIRSRSSARTRRSGAPGSRPSWRRPMCCRQ